MNYSPALKLFILLVLVALTLGLKWAAAVAGPSNVEDTQLRVAEFLARQHFAVSVPEKASEGWTTIRATTPGCRMLVTNSSVLGWDRDVIAQSATAGDRVFVVYRGSLYAARPSWLTASYLWSRLLREMGVKVQPVFLLTVAAESSCDAERLPWDQVWTDAETGMLFLRVTIGVVPHAPSFLASDAAKAIFSTLQLGYDYVIVDLAPLVAGVDARMTTRFVEALGPVFSWRENGLESDAERFVFQIRDGFPNRQMSDS